MRVGVVAARSPHKQAAERRGARAWRNSTQFRHPLRVKTEFFVLYRDRVSFAMSMQANIWPLKVEILRTTPRCRGEFRCRNIDHRLSTRVVMVNLPHLARWITNNLPIERRAFPKTMGILVSDTPYRRDVKVYLVPYLWNFSRIRPRISEPYNPSDHDGESLEHFRVHVPGVKIVRCKDHIPRLV